MKQRSLQRSFLQIVLIGMLFTTILSCEKTDDDTSSGYKGTWVRAIGASGDETDIAIGNITGESENRVYMCEWRGAVGLYKGTINGDIIHWDATYGLPDAQVGLESGRLTFYYPSVASSLKTYYDDGTWSSHCGPLAGSGSGSGGGGGGSPTVHPKGQFKIIVNRPTGTCASANTTSYPLAWKAGTVVTNTFDANGIECCSVRIVNQGYGPAFSSTANSWTYTSSTGAQKLYWEFFPNRSSWPTSCSQVGSAVIDYEGQVKTIVIW
jgi:hypothetical protein